MRLLIVTQKVNINDDVLGFFHDWLLEFAKRFEKVTVICLEKGEYNLPENVKVLSLGKEKGNSRLQYIKNFYKYIWQERNNYNQVFVHMNPEYVVLGGLFWRLLNKKISLWYVHKNVDLKLRVAEKLVQNIFTASKESCNLKSKKIQIVGHGINVDRYICSLGEEKKTDILCVGRISEIKNQKLLIEAVDILVNQRSLLDLKVVLIGGVGSKKDEQYKKGLEEMVKRMGLKENVFLIGSVPNNDISKYYREAKISINLCPTGGMDKVVLESVLSCVPVIVYNKTFKGVLDDKFILENISKRELSEKIQEIFEIKKDEMLDSRNQIKEKFSLVKLVDKIINFIKV